MVVFPLPIAILQLLTVLLSIAVEAIVLQNKLRFSRQKSIQFSISINLFSTIILWLSFFIVRIIAPYNTKMQLMSIIFFNRLYEVDRLSRIYPAIVFTFGIIFILILVAEFKGLQILEAFLDSSAEQEEEEEAKPLINRLNFAMMQTDSNRLSAIFQANALSSSVVLFLVILLNLY